MNLADRSAGGQVLIIANSILGRRLACHIRAIGGLALAGILLAGCSASPIVGAKPSQSGMLSGNPYGGQIGAANGTLTNTAVPSSVAPKRFNPFVEEDSSSGKRLVIDKPTLADVMQPGPLPEHAIGSSSAPITVIKYASMTCPYCRQFQTKTFPILKQRYIDTGKIRFILREFPIGFQSGAATIALRCVAPDKYFAAYEALLNAQPQWISQEVRHDPIFNVVKKFGLSRAAFDACYKDDALIANLNAVKERGRTLGVIGTPNFFVNNKLYKSVLTMTDFDRIVGEAQASPGAVTAAVR